MGTWATDFVSVARAEGDTLMSASRVAQDKLAALKRHLAAEDLSDSIAHVQCFAERFLAIHQKNVQGKLQAEKRSAAAATTAARLNPPSSSKNSPLVSARKETTNGEDVLMQFIDQAEEFFGSPGNSSPKGSPGRRRRRRGSTIGSRRQRVNPSSTLFTSDDTLREDDAAYLEVNIAT